MEAAARADQKIAELLSGKTIVKTILVPAKMVNFVVRTTRVAVASQPDLNER
jgi:leucyl-tRNA synthetase